MFAFAATSELPWLGGAGSCHSLAGGKLNSAAGVSLSNVFPGLQYAGDDDAPLLTVSTPKSAKKKTPAAKAKPASLTPKSASKSAAKTPPKPDATASNAGKAKRSRKRNPEESSKTLATFSVARIRAMMKQDPKVDMLSGDSTTAMSYATECFLRHFAKAVYAKRTPGARMITYDTMSEAVASDKSFTFLQGAHLPRHNRNCRGWNHDAACIVASIQAAAPTAGLGVACWKHGLPANLRLTWRGCAPCLCGWAAAEMIPERVPFTEDMKN